MRDYARKRGWDVVIEVKDVGSGATLRQKREDLSAAARRRDIDLVVVWRLDRWGRSLVDLVNTLQELVSLKVGFVSLSEALDLTTASGRALAGMLAVFAEFERDILRDRVKAGIAQARKEGKPTAGRSPPDYTCRHSSGRACPSVRLQRELGSAGPRFADSLPSLITRVDLNIKACVRISRESFSGVDEG